MILGREPWSYGVTELSRQIDCTKSGTYKILSSLVAVGLAARTPDRKYTLGHSVYILGERYSRHVGLASFCRPYLQKLRDMTEENASFSILSHNMPILVWRENSHQNVRVVGSSGQSRSPYVGSIGKVLTAFRDPAEVEKEIEAAELIPFTPNTITDKDVLKREMAQIRAQGYAVSDGEYSMDTYGLAVPVFDSNRKIWAALSLGIPASRINEQSVERYLKALREVAAEMEEKID